MTEQDTTNQDVDTQLAELSRQLREHPGEFVLMIQRTMSDREGPGGCFAPDRYYDRQVTRTLGVIAPVADDYALDDDSRELPTSRYLIEGRRPRPDQVSQGAWTHHHLISSRHGLHSGFAMPLAFGLRQEISWAAVTHGDSYAGERELEIIVGDQAVQTWFTWRQHRVDDLIWPEKSPLWFQQAAEALGRPLASAPELEASRARERQQLLEALWELNDQAAPLRQELKALQAARRGSGVYTRGGAVGLVQDDDDLRVHSMRPSRKLTEIQENIRRLLTRARELGLDSHPYVQAFELRYAVKETVQEASQ